MFDRQPSLRKERGGCIENTLANEARHSPVPSPADERPPDALRLHPRPLRRVLALAEGRRPVHRRPPRRGRLPDRRGAGAPRQHVVLHRRALLPGARIRGLPRAPAGRARGVPARRPPARATDESGAAVLARPERRTSPRWPPTTSTSRTPRGKSSRSRGGGGDRRDRGRGQDPDRRHRPDGVLRLLPAPPADAARPPSRAGGQPLAGGAGPHHAHRRGDAGDRAVRRAGRIRSCSRTIKLARHRKAATIAIADATLSEVSKLAQITIYYSSNTPAFVRSHTALLGVIQALAYGVYARDADQHNHRIKAFRLK